MTKAKSMLLYSTLVVVFFFFAVTFMVKAEAFLIPLTTAVILALLVLPLSQKMEAHSINRSSASLLNSLFLLLISFGFLFLISFQVKNIVDDWGEIKKTMEPKVEQLKVFIMERSPMGGESLDIEEEDIPILNNNANVAETQQAAVSFFRRVSGFTGDYLLTFIYIFFLLNYRRHFRKFLLWLFPEEKKAEVGEILNKSAQVTQQYLVGKIVLIAILAALYSVGLGLSGVENFIIISILAANLSIIPYLGNIIGFGIAMTYGLITSGETGLLAGIVITFSVAQFVESYILEPYIVGDRVDLHPFFVILAAVLGNSLWGIMGMVLAIPILAIINVVLLDIPSLQAFGFLLSNKPPSEKI